MNKKKGLCPTCSGANGHWICQDCVLVKGEERNDSGGN